MNAVYVILTLCSVGHPERCEAHRVPFPGSLASCRSGGWQPVLAQFLADRPGLALGRADCATGEDA